MRSIKRSRLLQSNRTPVIPNKSLWESIKKVGIVVGIAAGFVAIWQGCFPDLFKRKYREVKQEIIPIYTDSLVYTNSSTQRHLRGDQVNFINEMGREWATIYYPAADTEAFNYAKDIYSKIVSTQKAVFKSAWFDAKRIELSGHSFTDIPDYYLVYIGKDSVEIRIKPMSKMGRLEINRQPQ